MPNDPVETIKKLMTAMEEMLEALKIQQDMVKMVMEQQLKTADYLIKIAKKIGYDEKTPEPTKSSD